MWPFTKAKNMFGPPRWGVHKYRIFNISLVDVGLALFLAYIFNIYLLIYLSYQTSIDPYIVNFQIDYMMHLIMILAAIFVVQDLNPYSMYLDLVKNLRPYGRQLIIISQIENSVKSLKKFVNREMNLVHEWLVANKLTLNLTKTKYMLFHNKKDEKNKIKNYINFLSTSTIFGKNIITEIKEINKF